MSLIRCLFCRSHQVHVENLVCPSCRNAAASPSSLDDLRRDLQQYRMVMPWRFSDTKRFLNRMRTTARTAGFEDVEGDAVVRIVGQRSTFGGDPVLAYRMVAENLAGLGFGPLTNVVSMSCTLIPDGKPWTAVTVRAMLDDELRGLGGVSR